MDVVQHQILSLDFRQYTVSYEGKDFPSGTIVCDALNIPARRGYSARCTSKIKKYYQREKRNCHRNLSVSNRLRWRMGRNIF